MTPNSHPQSANAPEPLRDYQLRKLLTRRQALADAAVEHLCHDLPGADLLWQAVGRVEDRLRREYPAVWARSNGDWVATDAARLHTADRPAPDSCRICRQWQVPDVEVRPAS
ncbi:hypothetical protein ACI79G_14935 [Geodermatophilus sp. SYSU D00779]